MFRRNFKRKPLKVKKTDNGKPEDEIENKNNFNADITLINNPSSPTRLPPRNRNTLPIITSSSAGSGIENEVSSTSSSFHSFTEASTTIGGVSADSTQLDPRPQNVITSEQETDSFQSAESVIPEKSPFNDDNNRISSLQHARESFRRFKLRPERVPFIGKRLRSSGNERGDVRKTSLEPKKQKGTKRDEEKDKKSMINLRDFETELAVGPNHREIVVYPVTLNDTENDGTNNGEPLPLQKEGMEQRLSSTEDGTRGDEGVLNANDESIRELSDSLDQLMEQNKHVIAERDTTQAQTAPQIDQMQQRTSQTQDDEETDDTRNLVSEDVSESSKDNNNTNTSKKEYNVDGAIRSHDREEEEENNGGENEPNSQVPPLAGIPNMFDHITPIFNPKTTSTTREGSYEPNPESEPVQVSDFLKKISDKDGKLKSEPSVGEHLDENGRAARSTSEDTMEDEEEVDSKAPIISLNEEQFRLDNSEQETGHSSPNSNLNENEGRVDAAAAATVEKYSNFGHVYSETMISYQDATYHESRRRLLSEGSSHTKTSVMSIDSASSSEQTPATFFGTTNQSSSTNRTKSRPSFPSHDSFVIKEENEDKKPAGDHGNETRISKKSKESFTKASVPDEGIFAGIAGGVRTLSEGSDEVFYPDEEPAQPPNKNHEARALSQQSTERNKDEKPHFKFVSVDSYFTESRILQEENLAKDQVSAEQEGHGENYDGNNEEYIEETSGLGGAPQPEINETRIDGAHFYSQLEGTGRNEEAHHSDTNIGESNRRHEAVSQVSEVIETTTTPPNTLATTQGSSNPEMGDQKKDTTSGNKDPFGGITPLDVSEVSDSVGAQKTEVTNSSSDEDHPFHHLHVKKGKTQGTSNNFQDVLAASESEGAQTRKALKTIWNANDDFLNSLSTFEAEAGEGRLLSSLSSDTEVSQSSQSSLNKSVSNQKGVAVEVVPVFSDGTKGREEKSPVGYKDGDLTDEFSVDGGEKLRSDWKPTWGERSEYLDNIDYMLRSSGGGSDGNKLTTKKKLPTKEELEDKLKRNFILDGVCCDSLSQGYYRQVPRIQCIRKPYNALKDRALGNYFENKHLVALLNKTGQLDYREPRYRGVSIEGAVEDRAYNTGEFQYILKRRNRHGCGRAYETYKGIDLYYDLPKQQSTRTFEQEIENWKRMVIPGYQPNSPLERKEKRMQCSDARLDTSSSSDKMPSRGLSERSGQSCSLFKFSKLPPINQQQQSPSLSADFSRWTTLDDVSQGQSNLYKNTSSSCDQLSHTDFNNPASYSRGNEEPTSGRRAKQEKTKFQNRPIVSSASRSTSKNSTQRSKRPFDKNGSSSSSENISRAGPRKSPQSKKNIDTSPKPTKSTQKSPRLRDQRPNSGRK